MTILNELVAALVKQPNETWRLDLDFASHLGDTIPVHCPRCFEYKDPDDNPNPKYNVVKLTRMRRGKYLIWLGRCKPCGLFVYTMKLWNLRGKDA